MKVLACLRLLRTGDSYDRLDDGACMAEETIRQYFRLFCVDVKHLYEGIYLNRKPTTEELREIESMYRSAGFTGCGGAIDCMKLVWKNCPIQEKGQYHNPREGHMATIVVEAWCDRRLYVWSWFSGRAGTNNDLNVLSVSPLIQDILQGRFEFSTGVEYKIGEDGTVRKMLYLLGDGIYPDWPLFAKPIHHPANEREQLYSKRQEAIRKDIERCFGVLQSRFEILRRENRRWNKDEVVRISEVCAIIHNMIIRMVELGDLGDDEDDDNVLLELFEEESELNNLGSDAQALGTISTTAGEMDLGEFNDYAERMMIQEFTMTSRSAFATLQDELACIRR